MRTGADKNRQKLQIKKLLRIFPGGSLARTKKNKYPHERKPFMRIFVLSSLFVSSIFLKA